MAKLAADRTINRLIAREAGPEVAQHALRIGVKAEGLLATHHRSGEHRIEVDHGKVDAYVSLVGPAALSVEEGHFDGYGGHRTYVEGLHVLRRAAGLG